VAHLPQIHLFFFKMPNQSVRVDADVLQDALARKPHYLTTTAFLTGIIDEDNKRGLHGVSRLTERAEGGDTDSSDSNKFEASVVSTHNIRNKEKFIFKVPDDLQWCDESLMTFWKEGKKGAKTEFAAKYLFTELLKIEAAYGKQVVLDQLRQATAHRWESVTAVNYERYGLPSPKASTQGSEVYKSNAGAYRDFTAERLEREKLEKQEAEQCPIS
jgi:hypothetical protein